MADPKGFLVVPIGFRADGSLHSLELTDSDFLKVAVQSFPVQETDIYGWDGSTWIKLSVDSSGRLTLFQQTPNNLQVGNNFFDGSNWQKAKAFSDGILQTLDVPNKYHSISTLTQLTGGNFASAGETTLYTVPANKSFYLYTLTIGGSSTDAVPRAAQFRIYDAVPAIIDNIQYGLGPNGGGAMSVTFERPMKLSAGFSLRVFSPSAGVSSLASYYGFEE